MARQKRRRSRRGPLMGSHQRCWLWGRHVVLETLRAGRWPVIELRIADDLDAPTQQTVAQLAGRLGIPVQATTSARLAQLCGARDHQGLLAKMRPFPYRSLAEVAAIEKDAPALVMLDRIQDPHNFGAVIRAAEVLGMDGMIIGVPEQSEVNSLAARSSAGAVNYLPIAQSTDLVETVCELRQRGFSVVSASAHRRTSPDELDWTGRTLLILGNESTGVSTALLSQSDAIVTIPQSGHVDSLNVAVAAGILFYEIRRQRAMR